MFCVKMKKIYRLKVWFFFVPGTIEFPFLSFLLCCMTVSNASSKVKSHKQDGNTRNCLRSRPTCTNIVGLCWLSLGIFAPAGLSPRGESPRRPPLKVARIYTECIYSQNIQFVCQIKSRFAQTGAAWNRWVMMTFHHGTPAWNRWAMMTFHYRTHASI